MLRHKKANNKAKVISLSIDNFNILILIKIRLIKLIEFRYIIIFFIPLSKVSMYIFMSINGVLY